MRTKIHVQPRFPLISSHQPKEVLLFQERYDKISSLLDANPAILDAVHDDLARMGADSGRESTFSSEQYLRMIVIKTVEGLALRDTIVRVADSDFLRNFTRIFSGRMMNFTALQSALKLISEKTWALVNNILFTSAHTAGVITGERLRIDSTVCESNIHYPTDSSLLWDSYRVGARLIRNCAAAEPRLDLGNRFHESKAKQLYTLIATQSARKRSKRAVKRATNKLIKRVESVCDIATDVLEKAARQPTASVDALGYLAELETMVPRFRQVVSCARRVWQGEKVPAADRIFSIFESHTELLKRGKAHKPVEFGHLVTLAQTAEKFISFYCVEEHSRHDRELGDVALNDHKRRFKSFPREFTADKNYYGGPEHLQKWEQRIKTYAVGKKGRRNEDETLREHSPLFRLLQKFRAGCEGSISVLKRVFGLYRCLYRGFKSFASSIGRIVFCHNLVVLSRL